ncbi:MAG: PIN domain-containing protein [Deltaproteobacteria bacterium]|nr:PIN domain-containing protein [Deltaproteobacteria bacterium]
MRVIADTSIWSLALRRHSPVQNPESETLRKIIQGGEDIYLIGIILQEILQGIKKPEDFTSLKKYLDAFPLLEIKRGDYIKAAELKNHLSRKGVQVSAIDVLIAVAAIVNDCCLYTNDRDFDQIAKHSQLKLLRPEGKR